MAYQKAHHIIRTEKARRDDKDNYPSSKVGLGKKTNKAFYT